MKTRTRTIKVKSRKRKTSGSNNILKTIGYSMVYGAMRTKIAQLVSPVTQKLPFGEYSDNVGMLGVTAGAVKFAPNGMIKEVAKAGLSIEGAFLGQELISNNFSMNNKSQNPNNYIIG